MKVNTYNSEEGGSNQVNTSDEQLKADIGRIVHGDYHAIHGWDTPLVNRLVDVFEAHCNKAVEEAYDLLFWKYKELNGQSVDKKFAEAYGILKAGLKQEATLDKRKEGAE